ncbi:zeta toxin family protein [Pedobacter antarcticus]|uniref:zeta toxin family protein n=1 Tax=Pedobacter antarcticus TaxID=34086 RepID=UPI00292F1CD7|nr:zeta toxin family protein [Pedobacter antarcticus]
MSLSVKPQLFIITGSNGAGKSTLKQALLPPEFSDLDIFDGDIFYTQKSTEFYKQHGSSKEAKKQANESLEQHFRTLITSHIANRLNFAYEGHFTGVGAWATPQQFKAAGFNIHLVFCGLKDVVKSIQRVEIRFKKGGFHVTPLDIDNNFQGNMHMLNKNFRMFDSIEVLDTSDTILPICHLSIEGAHSPLQDKGYSGMV